MNWRAAVSTIAVLTVLPGCGAKVAVDGPRAQEDAGAGIGVDELCVNACEKSLMVCGGDEVDCPGTCAGAAHAAHAGGDCATATQAFFSCWDEHPETNCGGTACEAEVASWLTCLMECVNEPSLCSG